MESRRWPAFLAALVVAVSIVPMAAAQDPESTTVHITGQLLDVNGHTEIPSGLMGLHADAKLSVERATDWGIDGYRAIRYVPGSGSIVWNKDGQLVEPFKSMRVVIDCQGDRFYPAMVLTKPDYEEYFTRIGREYAQTCKDLGWKGYAEFWNEPYLNWAERSRKNYDPKYYDVSKAVEDGPVTIKGWDKPLKYLKWRRLWAQGANGKINYLVPVPQGAKAGDEFEYEQKLYFAPKGVQKYTVVEKWDVYDPTAPSFWSGKQNYDFYMWMFLPWAKAIKQTNPDVTVIGGWDFPLITEDWAAWKLLYKPLIDESIDVLDGISEHHYGSNTRTNAATYEVAVGYAMAEHGKRLHCFNTETAGCVDPAVPGNVHGQATPYGAFNYGLRDIAELIYRSPDKAVSRTAHGSLTPGWGGGGDEFLFKLLKDLRGRLVHGATEDLNVWPVAGLNGNQLVVVLFNDHEADRSIDLTVDAPAGTTFDGGIKAWVEPTSQQGPLKARQDDVAARGRQLKTTLTVPQKTGVKLVLNLQGKPADEVQRSRRQFFAKGILNEVTPDAAVTLKVPLDAELLKKPQDAWVKLVLEKVDANEATLTINGQAVQIPAHDWLTEVRIDPAWLKADNTVVFKSSGDGYRVGVASIVVDVAGAAPLAVPQVAAPAAEAKAAADTVYHTVVDGVDFKLFIPAGDKPLKGLIVHVANYKMDPRDRWAVVSRHMGFGHVAISMDMKRNNRPKLMRKALDAGLEMAAKASGRAELTHLPMAGVGHSAGGMATRVLLETPERTLGNCVSCGWIMDPAKLEPAQQRVPACFTLGAVPDAFKMLPGIDGSFKPARKQGLPWSLGVQHYCAHDWGNSATFFVPWLQSIAAMRLPDAPAADGSIPLKPVDAGKGWLGDLDSTGGVWATVAPVDEYKGNAAGATWLPDRRAAFVWRALMARDTPVQLTATVAGDDAKALGAFKPKSSFEMTIGPDESLVLGVQAPEGKGPASVTFYDGDEKLATVTAAPWTYTWKNVATGPHAVSAVWTTADGKQGTTNPALILKRSEADAAPVRTVEME